MLLMYTFNTIHEEDVTFKVQFFFPATPAPDVTHATELDVTSNSPAPAQTPDAIVFNDGKHVYTLLLYLPSTTHL